MLTKSQINAFNWLRDRGSDGMFDKHGVLIAQGETCHFTRGTWNALRDLGIIKYYDKLRVRIVRGLEE